jgi:hypothetical protein
MLEGHSNVQGESRMEGEGVALSKEGWRIRGAAEVETTGEVETEECACT